MTKRAKILSEEQLMRAIAVARLLPNNALRDEIYLLLSHRCGLRSKEIANLWVEDITDADGKVTSRLEVTRRGAKFGKERTLEMPPSLVVRLQQYVDQLRYRSGPLFRKRAGGLLTAGAVQWAIKRVYVLAGLKGASSHSGRRTFLTNAARKAHQANCTIFDVQHLAGHAYITSTMPYVELSPEQSRLVSSIHSPALDTFVLSGNEFPALPPAMESPASAAANSAHQACGPRLMAGGGKMASAAVSFSRTPRRPRLGLEPGWKEPA